MSKLQAYARSLVQAGFSIVPPKPGTKRPMENWAKYQITPATQAAVTLWYMDNNITGIGIVTGKVSGGLEVIDFDDMEAYERCVAWIKDNPKAKQIMEMVSTVEERSPKGVHWFYRVHGSKSYPSQKLAQFKQPDGSLKCLIETRGEGGYIIVAPTELDAGRKYYMNRGESHANIVTLTVEQRNLLIDRITDMSESRAVEKKEPKEIFVAPEGADRPGDGYERVTSWEEVLTPHGWTIFQTQGNITQWCKPGAEDRHCHATTGKTPGLYVFSSNAAPFEPNRSYSKFAAYTLLNCYGDYNKAAAELATKGFGSANSILFRSNMDANTPIEDRLGIKSALDIYEAEYPDTMYICNDILPEGLIILAGASKIGKSWFALDLCLTVGSNNQRKFLGKYPVLDDIECLYFALEDGEARLHKRMHTIMESQPAWSANRHEITKRSHIITAHPPALDGGFCQLLSEYLTKNQKCKIVIVDVLNNIKSGGKGGSNGMNAYEADSKALIPIQQLALAHHCCIVMITHLRKTSAISSGDPFEEVTGSLGTVAKADTTMVFKKGVNTGEGKLYVRGRDSEEKTIDLQFVDCLWYAKDEDAQQEEGVNGVQYKYFTDFIEYFEETGKSAVTPGEFGKWYANQTGSKMSNPAQTLKKWYERGVATRYKGRYGLIPKTC